MSINVNISSSAFLAELMKLSTDIIWKDQTLANQCENPSYSIDVEIFLTASNGLLTFDTIYAFDEATLRMLGMSDEAVINAMDDKRTIPETMRDEATRLFVANLLKKDPKTDRYVNYVEHNNYYRMLNGLPDEEDTKFIYNTEYEDIPMMTPIHELSLVDRYTLEERGFFKRIYDADHSKKYVKYMAMKCIDIFKSRTSERFSIMYMNPSEYLNMYNDFKDVYNNCRYNLIKVYYNTAFSKNNNAYEGFMAMCIVFMTVQLMHYKYLDVDITRDFYDLDSIRYIYESYGVPFFSSIPLEYHKKIVKNINRLLSYKGSTRVFFDLFDIFNYGDMNVFEYYIMKTHKFDDHGMPVFIKKPDGTYDTKSMYDIKFGKVRLYDDPPMELSDPVNHIPFNIMTAIDPYWVSDEALMDKIYDEDFNYLESKYVGIQTMFDMMKIMYESAYFFKMLTDNRAPLATTLIYYNMINKNVNIFDLVIYTCALISKKYGFAGNIPTGPVEVSKIIGFNFQDDLIKIRDEISKNPYLNKDTYIANALLNMDVNNLNAINVVFAKIMDLKEYFIEKLSMIRDKEEWFAYNQLYQTLLCSEYVSDVYKKQNGKVADSFMDLLSDLNIELYLRANSEELDIPSEVDNVLIQFKRSFTNLKSIEYADGIDISTLIEHLFKILNFFKSAKSELTGYNITYAISARGVNTFKLLSQLEKANYKFHVSNGESGFKYLLDTIYKSSDHIMTRSDFRSISDKLMLSATTEVTHIKESNLMKESLIKELSHIWTNKDDEMLSIVDALTGIYSDEDLRDEIPMYDTYKEFRNYIIIHADDLVGLVDNQILRERVKPVSKNLHSDDYLKKEKYKEYQREISMVIVDIIMKEVSTGNKLASNTQNLIIDKNGLSRDKTKLNEVKPILLADSYKTLTNKQKLSDNTTLNLIKGIMLFDFLNARETTRIYESGLFHDKLIMLSNV